MDVPESIKKKAEEKLSEALSEDGLKKAAEKAASHIRPDSGPETVIASPPTSVVVASSGLDDKSPEPPKSKISLSGALSGDRLGSEGSSGGISAWTLLFLAAIVIHAADAFFLDFHRSTSVITVGVFLSLGIALLLPSMRNFRIYGDDWLHNSGFYFIVSLVCLFTPYLISVVVESFPSLNFISFVYLLMNPLMIYVMFNAPEETLPAKAMKLWFIFWVLILIVSLLANFTIKAPTISGAEVAMGWRQFYNIINDDISKSWDKITNAKNTLNAKINGSLSEYYITGEEEQTGKNLGVRLEDVKPTMPYFAEGQPPEIMARVSAYSFLQDSINLVPTCLIDRRKKDYEPATVDPPSLEVFRNHDEMFLCTFHDKLEPGTYPVIVSTVFDFETWADVTYYFVKEETIRNYARLNKDIHYELQIPRKPTSIYTKGPVKIGIGGSDTPLVVTNTTPYLKNAYFGFTVDSAWGPGGEIKKVNELEIKLPKGFTLSDCDRKEGDIIMAQEDPDEPTYNRYIFRNVVNKDLPYTSVRCKLGLESPDVLQELEASDYASRTFLARTTYTYQINEKTSFTIK